MSREKELLVHALDRLKHINFEDDHLTNDLIQTIQKYLAQPEQEQEPVAWQLVANFVTDGDFLQYIYSKPRDELYEYYRITPLYTAPPKREPLGLEIMDVCGSEDYREGFKDGALYAEKCHGIGVKNDN